MEILYTIMFIGYLFFSVLTSYVIRKISQYFEKRKERKRIEQEHANNLLNYSAFYIKENFKLFHFN